MMMTRACQVCVVIAATITICMHGVKPCQLHVTDCELLTAGCAAHLYMARCLQSQLEEPLSFMSSRILFYRSCCTCWHTTRTSLMSRCAMCVRGATLVRSAIWCLTQSCSRRPRANSLCSLAVDVCCMLAQVAEHVDDQTPYEPFALMLQFALEPLLLPNGGAAASPHSLSAIAKILRTLKRTSDASPTPKTHNLCAAVGWLARLSPATCMWSRHHRQCQGCCCHPAAPLAIARYTRLPLHNIC